MVRDSNPKYVSFYRARTNAHEDDNNTADNIISVMYRSHFNVGRFINSKNGDPFKNNKQLR